MHYAIEDYLRNIPIEKLEEFIRLYEQGLIKENYDYALEDLKRLVELRKANQELNRQGFWSESGPTVIGRGGK